MTGNGRGREGGGGTGYTGYTGPSRHTGYRFGIRDASRPSPTRVGEFLESFLEHQGVKAQVERVAALEEWAERVGPKIAAVTRARSVAEGTLFVEVRSSAWLMELNMMKRPILARLNEGRPGAPLEKLVFVLSQDG